ncbi:MAG TPA: PEP-utilizing enzyme [Patescibacteria group bacterium]
MVSRELGTPSIVGTNIATRVFKDGDLLEVDADTEIAKKVG